MSIGYYGRCFLFVEEKLQMPNKPKVLCRNPDCSELVEAGTKLGVDASR